MKIINELLLMKRYGFIEKTFATAEGYYGVVTFDSGYRSGYVALPKGHVLYMEVTTVAEV